MTAGIINDQRNFRVEAMSKIDGSGGLNMIEKGGSDNQPCS